MKLHFINCWKTFSKKEATFNILRFGFATYDYLSPEEDEKAIYLTICNFSIMLSWTQ